MCLPAPYLPIHTTAHTHTHTHTEGLRFRGSYDTIQILLAAYSREMCFAQSRFPQKSRFSLPRSFDPHGTGGLCQQSCVSAGGPSRPPRCHSLLSVTARAAQPQCGAVTRLYTKNFPWDSKHHEDTESHSHTNAHKLRHTDTKKHLPHNRFYEVWLEVRQIWVAPLMTCSRMASVLVV